MMRKRESGVDSGTMPSLCKGAASEPTGRPGRGSSVERSQDELPLRGIVDLRTQNQYFS